MPFRIKTFCHFPNCKELSEQGNYCELHRKERRRQNFHDRSQLDKTLIDRDKFYSSSQWRKLRLWFLRQYPLCNACGELGHHVDHVVPIVTGINPYLLDNLQTLCASCHASKTRLETR